MINVTRSWKRNVSYLFIITTHFAYDTYLFKSSWKKLGLLENVKLIFLNKWHNIYMEKGEVGEGIPCLAWQVCVKEKNGI